MILRTLLLLICTFSALLAHSQMMPSRPVQLGLYTESGERMHKKMKNTAFTFGTISSYALKGKIQEISSDRVEDNNGFQISADYGEYIYVKAEWGKRKMEVFAQDNIDSLPFMDGKFYFNRAACFLFNLIPAKDVIISNLDFSDFGKPGFKAPSFIMQEEDFRDGESSKCKKMAEKMEDEHGGKNWVKNLCNDVWERSFITKDEKLQGIFRELQNVDGDSVRTNILPLEKNTFIRHDFFLDDIYYHVISKSTDGVNWTEIMTVRNEWYVHLAYFPDSKKIGIEINNSGVFLVSDYQLKSWKYYLQFDYDDEEPERLPESEKAVIFRNANWSDDGSARVYFSD